MKAREEADGRGQVQNTLTQIIHKLTEVSWLLPWIRRESTCGGSHKVEFAGSFSHFPTSYSRADYLILKLSEPGFVALDCITEVHWKRAGDGKNEQQLRCNNDFDAIASPSL